MDGTARVCVNHVPIPQSYVISFWKTCHINFIQDVPLSEDQDTLADFDQNQNPNSAFKHQAPSISRARCKARMEARMMSGPVQIIVD